MSFESLAFLIDGEEPTSPVSLTTGTSLELTIINQGLEDLSDIGIYLGPSVSIGSFDFTSENSPAVDYQTILTWGEDTVLGEDTQGGLKITYSNGLGDVTAYFSRSQGADYSNRILLQNISSGDSLTITLEIETPTGLPATLVCTQINLG